MTLRNLKHIGYVLENLLEKLQLYLCYTPCQTLGTNNKHPLTENITILIINTNHTGSCYYRNNMRIKRNYINL